MNGDPNKKSEQHIALVPVKEIDTQKCNRMLF